MLGLLGRERTLSGYDLRKCAERSVGYFWAPARSQIYAVLPRLVGAALVTRRDVAQTQRPDKHVYRITAAGKRALRAWLEEPVDAEPDRDVFLLKLFFGGVSDPENMLRHVRRRREEAEQLRVELEAIGERVADADGDFYPALTRRYGIAWADAVAGWARATERELEQRLAQRRAVA